MLVIKNLSKSYGDKKVLRNINLKIKADEIVSVVGNNGCGKTTLFKLIANLINQDSGSITYYDEKCDYQIVSYLAEERTVMLDCTVNQQLKLLERINQRENISDRLLDILAIDKKLLNTKIADLSKGNKQKIALASCLIKDCPIYIFDEPFTALDSDNIEIMIKVINMLKYHHKTVLVSSHIYQPINQIADRLLYLKSSRIILDADREKLTKDERYLVETTETELFDDEFIICHYRKNNKTVYLTDTITSASKLVRRLLGRKKECYLRKITFEDLITITDLSPAEYSR
ncbi:MAG: ATP-binding cassette domain-containing protein [Erysipelotrichaceae bacterium]